MALLLLLPRRLRLPFLLRETRQERRGDSSSSGSSSSSSALLRSEPRRRQRRRRPEAGGARPRKSLFEECVFLLLLLFPANAALFLPLFLIWANTVKRRAARRGQSICACRKTMDERERSTRSRSRFFPFFPHFATGYFLSLPSRERFCSRLAPPFSHDGGALLRGHPRPPGRRCPRPGAVAALFRRGARRQTRHPRQRRRHFRRRQQDVADDPIDERTDLFSFRRRQPRVRRLQVGLDQRSAGPGRPGHAGPGDALRRGDGVRHAAERGSTKVQGDGEGVPAQRHRRARVVRRRRGVRGRRVLPAEGR